MDAILHYFDTDNAQPFVASVPVGYSGEFYGPSDGLYDLVESNPELAERFEAHLAVLRTMRGLPDFGEVQQLETIYFWFTELSDER